MNSKTMELMLECANASMRNAYKILDIVGDELLEIGDNGRHKELWNVQCMVDCLSQQIDEIIQRYRELPF